MAKPSNGLQKTKKLNWTASPVHQLDRAERVTRGRTAASSPGRSCPRQTAGRAPGRRVLSARRRFSERSEPEPLAHRLQARRGPGAGRGERDHRAGLRRRGCRACRLRLAVQQGPREHPPSSGSARPALELSRRRGGPGRTAALHRARLIRCLACGVLAHGFARLACRTCRTKVLVPFSCKSRGVCPSCNARRAHDTAHHLVERVLLRAPYRQWTLSFPGSLLPRPGRPVPLRGTRLLRPRALCPPATDGAAAGRPEAPHRGGRLRPALRLGAPADAPLPRPASRGRLRGAGRGHHPATSPPQLTLW
jgi:hypothetical protein